MRTLIPATTVTLGALLLTAGCSYHETKEVREVPVQTAAPRDVAPSAGRGSYNLIDYNGNRTATAHIDSSGYGHVYDNSGDVIGDITPPR